ncbi:MAG TPA: hypothetical protein VFT43_08095 [Candidatus Polarisedimenticolia bacterium]|nr:hypothetical protein [Candidatus Polarisedimenticolia bacterium]
MGRRTPPPLLRDEAGEGETGLARCPRCDAGELLAIALTRRGGSVGRAVYCAGIYDRERRRFLRRGCGYAATSERAAASVDPPRLLVVAGEGEEAVP